jgi:hypothetical protein
MDYNSAQVNIKINTSNINIEKMVSQVITNITEKHTASHLQGGWMA